MFFTGIFLNSFFVFLYIYVFSILEFYSIFDLLNYNKNSKFLQWFFYIIISYAFFRILRFEFFYLFIYFAVLLFVLYNKFLNKKLANLNFLFIVYLTIGTSFYFEKYVKIRAWDDLSKDSLLTAFKGEEINHKFKNLN